MPVLPEIMMRIHTSALPLLAAVTALATACADEAPQRVAPTPQNTIATATPYAQPPIPTIVDSSGKVAGTAANSTGGREQSYAVESGDTLIAIANRFDTTVEAIVRRNNILNPTDLQVGQQLIIPTASSVLGIVTPGPTPAATASPTATASATPRPTSTPARSGTPGAGALTYIVAEGDTAFGIAGRFGVSVEELAEANNRTVSSLGSLQVGDRLVIPRGR
jgi:LysM repeat protein